MQTSTPPPSGDSAFPIDKRWKELTRTLINRPSTVRGLHHCDLCSDDTTLSYLTRSQKYTIGDLQKHLYHSHMSCQWNDDPCKWGMHTNSSKWLRSHPFHPHWRKIFVSRMSFQYDSSKNNQIPHVNTCPQPEHWYARNASDGSYCKLCQGARLHHYEKELIHLREQRQAQRKSKSTKRIQRKEKEADLPNEDGVPRRLTRYCIVFGTKKEPKGFLVMKTLESNLAGSLKSYMWPRYQNKNVPGGIHTKSKTFGKRTVLTFQDKKNQWPISCCNYQCKSERWLYK